MKQFNVGQTIGILANLGVIAGIVFLGYELRQNNEFLAMQARADRGAIGRAAAARILNNSDLRRATLKARNGGVLTQEEEFLLELENQAVFRDWRYMWQESQIGLLDESTINTVAWQEAFHEGNPGMPKYWSENKHRYPAGFVQFIEDYVVNAL